ncbi:MAG: hypothetical protein RLZZ502_272, partial [Pseudomonadota bacterium]
MCASHEYATHIMRLIGGLHDLPAAAWDKLSKGHPLLSHAFFTALHDSHSACAKTGWDMQFLSWWDGGQLKAAMPLYVKHHSYGEYVFDWAWADAMHKAGRAYYPKLLAAIPFTPCPGARLLCLDDPTPYISDTIAFARASKLSSLHILLCKQAEAHAWQ